MDGDLTQDPSSRGPALVSSLDVGMLVDRARLALFGSADVEAAAGGGTRVGRYVLSRKLGSGATGTVHEARDVTLGRLVALKVLHRDLRARHHQRMQREALALARLSHPNVVHIYEIGRFEDRTFIAMELVHGRTLDQWQRQRPGWRECLQVYAQAGSGLASAHAAGLVHRDFKPSNCILGNDGRVRVLDFGLVRAVGDDEPDVSPTMDELRASRSTNQRLTETGALLGTLAYMPPEQLAGRVADASSDQFSFCVSLYEALYGERPFTGATIAELTLSLTHGEPKAPPRGTRVPMRLRRVLLRGLAVDPLARWPSMVALLHELGRVARRAPARSAWWVGIAAMIGVGGGAMLSSSDIDPCVEAETALSATWGEDQRAAVHAAFDRSGMPQAVELRGRVEAQLDGYASAWVASQAESCRATFVARQQSEELHDMRMRCLQRRRNRLESTIAALVEAEGPEVLLERAVLPFRLPSIEDCSDPEKVLDVAPLPSDPAARERIAELRRRLDEAQTMQAAGDFAQGIAVAQAVVDEARNEGFPPLLAEALEILGGLQTSGPSMQQAQATLEEAIREAARAKADVTSAKAWTWLLYALAVQDRTNEGLALELSAQAAVDRADDDEARGWLLNNLGVLHGVREDFPRAREHFRRALALKERTLGPEHVDVGISWYNLGILLITHGLHDEASEALEHARVVFEGTVGTEHPLALEVMARRCWLEQERGKPAKAVDICMSALELLDASPSLHSRWRVHYSLAISQHAMGQDREALEHAREALEQARAALEWGGTMQSEAYRDISDLYRLLLEAHHDGGTATPRPGSSEGLPATEPTALRPTNGDR